MFNKITESVLFGNAFEKNNVFLQIVGKKVHCLKMHDFKGEIAN
jgi:hypothetical protein